MTVTCGKTVTLPLTSNLIWAEMEVKKTLVDDLLTFFINPEP